VKNPKPELWVCLYDIHYPQFDRKTFSAILRPGNVQPQGFKVTMPPILRATEVDELLSLLKQVRTNFPACHLL
jgi:hypothetical protein